MVSGYIRERKFVPMKTKFWDPTRAGMRELWISPYREINSARSHPSLCGDREIRNMMNVPKDWSRIKCAVTVIVMGKRQAR